MPSLEQGLLELQEKFQSILSGVDVSMHAEIHNRWNNLKKMLKSNASFRCTCDQQYGASHGQVCTIKYDCPVHKGELNNLALCPLHMEDYTCAWSPEKVVCGDTPCSNVSKERRVVRLNRQGSPEYRRYKKCSGDDPREGIDTF